MMSLNLNKYRTIIFDCDGVLLNSNKIKTDAFRDVGLHYGLEISDALVSYHIENGGISRYKKFQYMWEVLLGKKLNQDKVEGLSKQYGAIVREMLLDCEVVESLELLRRATIPSGWMVVSGGDQKEIREIFNKRNLTSFFDLGIFGSPDAKEVILKREAECGNISQPALFFGDSKYDHIEAVKAKLDFCFIYGWTEFKDWKKYCDFHNLTAIRSISDII